MKTMMIVLLLAGTASNGQTTKSAPVAMRLQEVSVTVVTDRGEGSGVVVRRGNTNYVLTAAHVIAGLRRTRPVVDTKSGTSRTVVEFGDAKIVQKIYEDGRIVGQTEMVAKVLCYSDADHGEDLAVLQIQKKNFIDVSAQFYLGKDIPAIGSDLYHVGSLQGQFGSNSLTTGIVSQVGRVLDEKLYDQTSCTAFPGSSGGGVFDRNSGEYIGMLVRGAGETFNLIVPIRRIRQWTDRVGLSFVIDPSLKIPTADELSRVPIEDTGHKFEGTKDKATSKPDDSETKP